MKTTKNYNMTYPEEDDYFDVSDFQNMLILVDELMKEVSDSGTKLSNDANMAGEIIVNTPRETTMQDIAAALKSIAFSQAAKQENISDWAQLSGLSRNGYHLKGKKVKYWSEKTLKTRNYIKKWKESDQDRYS